VVSLTSRLDEISIGEPRARRFAVGDRVIVGENDYDNARALCRRSNPQLPLLRVEGCFGKIIYVSDVSYESGHRYVHVKLTGSVHGKYPEPEDPMSMGYYSVFLESELAHVD
jgi:hypothetical protein